MRKIIKNLLFLIPILLGLLLFVALPHFPTLTEKFFSSGIFVVCAYSIGFLTNLIPFSLTEILLIITVVALIFAIIMIIVKKLKITTFLKVIGWGLSCSFFMYMIMHGANYYRNDAYTLMNMPKDVQYTEQEIYNLCEKFAYKAISERETIGEDDNGVAILSATTMDTLSMAGNGYENLSMKYPFLGGIVSKAKPVILSKYWSYTGITGLYFPLFCEANVNIDVPAFTIPVSAAHELAHTRGFAREDECNFFAYLACVNSSSADYRYSGYLFAFQQLALELKPEKRQDLYNLLSAKVMKDIKAEYSYWKRFEGNVMNFSDKVNDTFIKSQGVEEGTKSYNEVSKLILTYNYN